MLLFPAYNSQTSLAVRRNPLLPFQWGAGWRWATQESSAFYTYRYEAHGEALTRLFSNINELRLPGNVVSPPAIEG